MVRVVGISLTYSFLVHFVQLRFRRSTNELSSILFLFSCTSYLVRIHNFPSNTCPFPITVGTACCNNCLHLILIGATLYPACHWKRWPFWSLWWAITSKQSAIMSRTISILCIKYGMPSVPRVKSENSEGWCWRREVSDTVEEGVNLMLKRIEKEKAGQTEQPTLLDAVPRTPPVVKVETYEDSLEWSWPGLRTEVIAWRSSL